MTVEAKVPGFVSNKVTIKAADAIVRMAADLL
jgi:hypothetical protein